MEDEQRFGLDPRARVILGTGLAAAVGLISGTTRGARVASLKFLAENAHRLPRNKGGWYFFHKRKNYVVLRDGMNQGAIIAAKYGAAAYAFFAIEAVVDRYRGRKDFTATTFSAALVGTSVAFIFARLPYRQAWRSALHFTLFGAGIGLLEDGLNYVKSTKRLNPVPSETK